jgi:hypothetical protein
MIKISFHVAYWNIIYGAIGIFCLCTLIPNLNLSSKKCDDIHLDLQSPEVKIAGVVLLTTSCPMILDAVLDFFNENLFKRIGNGLIGRNVYAFSTFIFGFHIALQYDVSHIFQTYQVSFFFILWCYRIVVLSTTMFFISVADPTPSTAHKTQFLTIWACCNAYLVNLKYDSMSEFINILWAGWFLFGLFFFARHIYQIWKSQMTYSHLITMITLIGLSIRGFLNLLSYFPEYIPMSPLDFKKMNILVAIYTYVVSTILCTVIPGRITRQEAINSKDRIISTKQAYVRYISHELRYEKKFELLISFFHLYYLLYYYNFINSYYIFIYKSLLLFAGRH